MRDGTRLEQLEFGEKIPAEEIILGRNKNRRTANICVLNRMRLCGLGGGVKINSDCRLLGYDAFVLVEMYRSFSVMHCL